MTTENPLADAVRARLEPENAESTSEPQLCCTLPAPVALTEVQQRLLLDLRAVLPERGARGRILRIGTVTVLQLLQAAPDSKWRGLSGHKLGRLLGSLGLHPKAIRFPGFGVRRGYECDELQSSFLTLLTTGPDARRALNRL
jgi:hypothetical protein